MFFQGFHFTRYGERSFLAEKRSGSAFLVLQNYSEKSVEAAAVSQYSVFFVFLAAGTYIFFEKLTLPHKSRHGEHPLR